MGRIGLFSGITGLYRTHYIIAGLLVGGILTKVLRFPYDHFNYFLVYVDGRQFEDIWFI